MIPFITESNFSWKKKKMLKYVQLKAVWFFLLLRVCGHGCDSLLTYQGRGHGCDSLLTYQGSAATTVTNTSSSTKCWSKHIKGSEERYFIRPKHNMQIFGVIPLIQLQNHT